MTYEIVFGVATALAVLSALGVVLSGNPFYSALSLILNLASLATLYLLLNADFLAAAQVIVYAGAVMIMFLFVVAYLGGRADEPRRGRAWWQVVAAVVAASAVSIEIIVAIVSASTGSGADVRAGFGSPSNVGAAFFSRYLLAFEATSILLLVAAVGGVVLGARRPELRVPGERDVFEQPLHRPELGLQASVMARETGFEVRPRSRTAHAGDDASGRERTAVRTQAPPAALDEVDEERPVEGE
jgi:NADH-quinone oxidoreductase subunit J